MRSIKFHPLGNGSWNKGYNTQPCLEEFYTGNISELEEKASASVILRCVQTGLSRRRTVQDSVLRTQSVIDPTRHGKLAGMVKAECIFPRHRGREEAAKRETAFRKRSHYSS